MSTEQVARLLLAKIHCGSTLSFDVSLAIKLLKDNIKQLSKILEDDLGVSVPKYCKTCAKICENSEYF